MGLVFVMIRVVAASLNELSLMPMPCSDRLKLDLLFTFTRDVPNDVRASINNLGWIPVPLSLISK